MPFQHSSRWRRAANRRGPAPDDPTFSSGRLNGGPLEPLDDARADPCSRAPREADDGKHSLACAKAGSVVHKLAHSCATVCAHRKVPNHPVGDELSRPRGEKVNSFPTPAWRVSSRAIAERRWRMPRLTARRRSGKGNSFPVLPSGREHARRSRADGSSGGIARPSNTFEPPSRCLREEQL